MTFSSAPASGQFVRFHPHDCVRTVLYEPPVKSDAFISKSGFMPPISAVMPSCDYCRSTTVISVCVCVLSFQCVTLSSAIMDLWWVVSVWRCVCTAVLQSTLDRGCRVFTECGRVLLLIPACFYTAYISVCVCARSGGVFQGSFSSDKWIIVIWQKLHIHWFTLCACACARRVFITLFRCSFSRIMILLCHKNKDEREDQY